MQSLLLERPAGCCPSNHILSAKIARATGDSAASTDLPPPPFRTALLLRKTPRSQRLNLALKASATAMRSLPGFTFSAVFRRAQWVGNPSTKAARMSIRSIHSLCAMASRKCERVRAVPDESRHRRAVSSGSNIQKLEGCRVSMRKSLHRAAAWRRCAVMAVLVPASRVVILTTGLRQAKRPRRGIC
jgi:hypothetical protein